MNKKELIERVSFDTSYSKATIKTVVESILCTIYDALINEEQVMLPGFGSFSTSVRPARKGHNPQTGKSINLPEKKVVKFKVGAALKRGVAGE